MKSEDNIVEKNCVNRVGTMVLVSPEIHVGGTYNFNVQVTVQPC